MDPSPKVACLDLILSASSQHTLDAFTTASAYTTQIRFHEINAHGASMNFLGNITT